MILCDVCTYACEHVTDRTQTHSYILKCRVFSLASTHACMDACKQVFGYFSYKFSSTTRVQPVWYLNLVCTCTRVPCNHQGRTTGRLCYQSLIRPHTKFSVYQSLVVSTRVQIFATKVSQIQSTLLNLAAKFSMTYLEYRMPMMLLARWNSRTTLFEFRPRYV